MNKRIALGIAVAAAAAGAALAGGVAYADDGGDGTNLRISYEQVRGAEDGKDCPEGAGSAPEADL